MAKFLLSAFADEANPQIDKQIEALQRNSIDYIEVRGVNGKNIIKLNDTELSDLKNKLNDAGIKVWSIGSPIGKISITDKFDEHFEDFKRTVEIANKLDCGNIRLFSFFIPRGEEPAKYKDEVFKRISDMLDFAEGTGVDLCHENEYNIYGENAERSLELLETFSPRLKGIFDPSNYILCKVETLSAFKVLRPYIKYMHIKDARMKDSKIVPSGYGDGNIKEILSILNKSNDDIVLSIEPHLSVFSGYSDLSDNTVLGTKEFIYKTNDDAFDAASNALKKIIGEV